MLFPLDWGKSRIHLPTPPVPPFCRDLSVMVLFRKPTFAIVGPTFTLDTFSVQESDAQVVVALLPPPYIRRCAPQTRLPWDCTGTTSHRPPRAPVHGHTHRRRGGPWVCGGQAVPRGVEQRTRQSGPRPPSPPTLPHPRARPSGSQDRAKSQTADRRRAARCPPTRPSVTIPSEVSHECKKKKELSVTRVTRVTLEKK